MREVSQNPFATIGMPASGPVLVTDTRNASVSLARFRSDDPGYSVMKSLPAEDSYVVIFHRDDVPGHDFWADGKHLYQAPSPKAALNIFDVSAKPSCLMTGRFDNMLLHIPRAALDDLADEADAPLIAELHAPDGWLTSDPVVEGIQDCIVSALEQPDETSRLFVDHIVLALHAHVARTYGGMRETQRRRSGGLAPWQERRAKELVAANLGREVSLQQIAQDCGLSVSHFSRAFKASTGHTPHDWLQTCRVDRAKDLLQDPNLSLAQIAIVCGFADQSHFTRIFTRLAGNTPGSWRHLRRAA